MINTIKNKVLISVFIAFAIIVLSYKFSPYGIFERSYIENLEQEKERLNKVIEDLNDLKQQNELLLKFNLLETQKTIKKIENERLKSNKTIDTLYFSDDYLLDFLTRYDSAVLYK